MHLDFPHTPGNDFAGTVSQVGPGVTAFAVGDEVFGEAVPRAMRAVASATRPSLSTGSLAEYAVFEADTPLTAHRPVGLPAKDAAALATAGLTALGMLGTAEVRPGDKVLVVGATGGVGTAVVPLLAAANASVTATATTADADIMRDLGAAEVIGYGEADYPHGVDVAFNLTCPVTAYAESPGLFGPVAAWSRSSIHRPRRIKSTATTWMYGSSSTWTGSSSACAKSVN